MNDWNELDDLCGRSKSWTSSPQKCKHSSSVLGRGFLAWMLSWFPAIRTLSAECLIRATPLHLSTCNHTHARTHIQTCTHTLTCTHTHIYPCMFVRANARTHAHTHIRTHARTHTRTHAASLKAYRATQRTCIQERARAHTHTHTQTHTHTRTHARARTLKKQI